MSKRNGKHSGNLSDAKRRHSSHIEAPKLPPHSTEAEQGVLGCILLASVASKEHCYDVLSQAIEKFKGMPVFYNLRHDVIFGAMVRMMAAPKLIDVITLQQWLKDNNELDDVGGISYLNQLQDSVPSSANVTYYADIVFEKFQLRRAAQYCQSIADKVHDYQGSVDVLLDEIVRDISRVAVGKPIVKLPPIIDAMDFRETDHPMPDQIIRGVLHRGSKLALGGGSKTFKTWTLLDLALSVSHGLDWLGFSTARSRVCYVNLEVAPWSFQRRLEAVAREKDMLMDKGWLQIWNLRGHAEGYRALLPKISEMLRGGNIGLLILDPSYKLYGDADENSARDVGNMLNHFEVLAQETGAAIAFASHFAKGNAAQKEAIDRISGSGVFARDPDAILTLTRHEQDDAFVVDSTLRNCATVPPFVVRWEYPLMRKDDGLDPTKLKMPHKGGRVQKYTAQQLMDCLPATGLETKAWAKVCKDEHGVSPSKFYDLLKILTDTKVVHKQQGCWVRKGSQSEE